MRFAFNLHKYDDVREQAEHILERLRAREMRCDGERRTERVDLFDRWVRGGKQP